MVVAQILAVAIEVTVERVARELLSITPLCDIPPRLNQVGCCKNKLQRICKKGSKSRTQTARDLRSRTMRVKVPAIYGEIQCFFQVRD